MSLVKNSLLLVLVNDVLQHPMWYTLASEYGVEDILTRYGFPFFGPRIKDSDILLVFHCQILMILLHVCFLLDELKRVLENLNAFKEVFAADPVALGLF